ncbi:MAG TPA: helix-turn-helix domain-containing protein [Brumimicrobium sp.]|nr:helix-turn-helix domain-containing protein [Brumimicrobium sp.]
MATFFKVELTLLKFISSKSRFAFSCTSFIQLINATAFKITQGIFLPPWSKKIPWVDEKISSYLWVCTDQNKMGNLTLEQRYKIETYLSLERNKCEIAAYIGKDKSVISREIKRNADARSGVYKAALADKKQSLGIKQRLKKILLMIRQKHGLKR